MTEGKRVLLVEDNEMNRDMLSRRLARRGFEVGIAVDGRSGVEMTLTGEFDVVLMDMNLPEIDGWEAARQIRAGEKGTPRGDHRAHRARDAGRPREGARRGLRRIRHEAGGLRAACSARSPRCSGAQGMSGRNSAVGELRHTFRTPVNHIVGYTEMLLEDLPPGDEEHREPLKVDPRGGARRARSTSARCSCRAARRPSDAVRRLYDELEEPQAQIIRAVTSLISAHDLGDAAADDLRRILHAAEQLRPKDLEIAASAPLAEEEPAEERAARVLVVDDVEDNRQLLKRRLEKQGYAVSMRGRMDASRSRWWRARCPISFCSTS